MLYTILKVSAELFNYFYRIYCALVGFESDGRVGRGKATQFACKRRRFISFSVIFLLGSRQLMFSYSSLSKVKVCVNLIQNLACRSRWFIFEIFGRISKIMFQSQDSSFSKLHLMQRKLNYTASNSHFKHFPQRERGLERAEVLGDVFFHPGLHQMDRICQHQD